MRGYDYLQFAGQNVVFANAELRFPLIEAALTPIGVIGGIRGVFFANIGGGWFNSQPSADTGARHQRLQVPTSATQTCRPVTGCDRQPRRNTDFDATRAATDPHLRPAEDDRRVPPEGRPRLVRLRPRDVRARLPDSLRLVVADDSSTRTWEDVVFAGNGAQRRRSAASAQAAVRGLDRLRLLGSKYQLGLGARD